MNIGLNDEHIQSEVLWLNVTALGICKLTVHALCYNMLDTDTAQNRNALLNILITGISGLCAHMAVEDVKGESWADLGGAVFHL